jgi:SOS-response transcriptional repressor LexA
MASAVRRVPRELGYRGCQVLAYVREIIEAEGMAPSCYRIRDALGFYDIAGVVRVVDVLERRGLLRRVGSGRVRRLRLVINNN